MSKALDRLTYKAVKRELDGCARMGRQYYLWNNDIRSRVAESYFIEEDGGRCDMQAIVYMALGRPPGRFGSPEVVAKRVAALGFKVIGPNGIVQPR